MVLVKGVAGSEASIVPVLINFVLALLALPILSLLWGAREEDLTEIWSRFLQGVNIGETRISPGDFLTFAIVFVIGYVLTRLLQGALRNNVLPKTKIDTGDDIGAIKGFDPGRTHGNRAHIAMLPADFDPVAL